MKSTNSSTTIPIRTVNVFVHFSVNAETILSVPVAMNRTQVCDISDLFAHDNDDHGEAIPASAKFSNNRGIATKVSTPYIPNNHSSVKGPAPVPQDSPSRDPPIPALPPLAAASVNVGSAVRPLHSAVVKSQAKGRSRVGLKFICYVCMRKFRDDDHLYEHKRRSVLHHRNLG